MGRSSASNHEQDAKLLSAQINSASSIGGIRNKQCLQDKGSVWLYGAVVCVWAATQVHSGPVSAWIGHSLQTGTPS